MRKSPLIGLSVQEAKEKFSHIDFINIAIKREEKDETVIPRGQTVFKCNDQVYFSVPKHSVDQMPELLGQKKLALKMS